MFEIPEHTLLRTIGRGSYGVVWLARNATGAWRAVKVLHRQPGDDSRAFEREFEGLRAFEPVSRAHDGHMDILHVGRNDAAGYFYYSMELADDLVRGRDVDPATYQPHTLRTQMQATGRLPPRDCLGITLQLARALEHLHEQGLVHRDLKPSNIVFVGGRPKLADVGLVATADSTRSFVGTEGYVPPEGPGTFQADLYALGKLLYEIATGCDRRAFPELPPGFGSWPDRPLFLELNKIASRACARDPHERYASAAELRADLERAGQGRPVRRYAWHRRHRLPLGVAALITLTALVTVGLMLLSRPHGSRTPPPDTTQPEALAHPFHHESVARITGHGRHTVVLTRGGHLLAWGDNTYGQLGTGDQRPRPWPTRVDDRADWTAVEAGDAFTLALRADGTLWVWGDNAFGQLGLGGGTNRTVPTPLGTDRDWQDVRAGLHNGYAVKRDGSLWGWGRNDKGQLLHRSDAHLPQPRRLAPPNTWRALSVNFEHLAAIRTDGSLWSWGDIANGRLGRPVAEGPAFEPGELLAGPGWTRVGVGFWHALALRNDGTLWGWGGNPRGQLGTGDTRTRPTPVQIGSDHDWTQLCVAAEHTLALKADGSLWAWGAGNQGEIGDGGRMDRFAPVRVNADTDWVWLPPAAGNTSFALKRDGSLWGWGFNRFGQLGNGTFEVSIQPVKILPRPE